MKRLNINEQLVWDSVKENPHAQFMVRALRDRAELLAVLRQITTAAREWHDIHCDSPGTFNCDEICAALPHAELAVKNAVIGGDIAPRRLTAAAPELYRQLKALVVQIKASNRLIVPPNVQKVLDELEGV